MQFLTSKLPAYLPFILLTLALMVSLFLAHRMWEEATEDVEPVSDHELLSEFEDAHAAGELDETELRRVRELLKLPRAADPRPVRPRLMPAPEPAGEAPDDPADPADSEDAPPNS